MARRARYYWPISLVIGLLFACSTNIKSPTEHRRCCDVRNDVKSDVFKNAFLLLNIVAPELLRIEAATCVFAMNSDPSEGNLTYGVVLQQPNGSESFLALDLRRMPTARLDTLKIVGVEEIRRSFIEEFGRTGRRRIMSIGVNGESLGLSEAAVFAYIATRLHRGDIVNDMAKGVGVTKSAVAAADLSRVIAAEVASAALMSCVVDYASDSLAAAALEKKLSRLIAADAFLLKGEREYCSLLHRGIRAEREASGELPEALVSARNKEVLLVDFLGKGSTNAECLGMLLVLDAVESRPISYLVTNEISDDELTKWSTDRRLTKIIIRSHGWRTTTRIASVGDVAEGVLIARRNRRLLK